MACDDLASLRKAFNQRFQGKSTKQNVWFPKQSVSLCVAVVVSILFNIESISLVNPFFPAPWSLYRQKVLCSIPTKFRSRLNVDDDFVKENYFTNYAVYIINVWAVRRPCPIF